MSKKPATAAPRLAGVTSFAADDAGYIAPPPREVREQAKAAAEAIGFISDKPKGGAPIAAEATPATPKKRARQPSQYPDHYNLRLREGDRERFDEYAYRHRIPKGEAFRIMLDLAEAEERRQGGAGDEQP